VERKKGEQYSREFQQHTVERMIACDNITRLSLEIGVVRHLLYNWAFARIHIAQTDSCS
jgi:transposase-like protein